MKEDISDLGLVEYDYSGKIGGDLISGDQIISKLIDDRNQAIKLAEEILDKCSQLNSLLEYFPKDKFNKYVSLADVLVRECSFYSDNLVDNYMTKVTKKFDSKFWMIAMERTRMVGLMHQENKEKFYEVVQSNKVMPFDSDHVFATINYYLENRVKVFVEGAVNLFQRLDSNYKTNDGLSFRKKIIFKNARSSRHYWNHYSSGEGLINDLFRVYFVFDGGDPTKIDGNSSFSNMINQYARKNIYEYENKYFKWKLFKNGNVHIWLINETLTEKLNKMIASYYGQVLGHRKGKRN